MNKKLLVGALVAGMIAGHQVMAQEGAAEGGDKPKAEKSSCKGKNGCGGKAAKGHKAHKGKKEAKKDAGAEAPAEAPAETPAQ